MFLLSLFTFGLCTEEREPPTVEQIVWAAPRQASGKLKEEMDQLRKTTQDAFYKEHEDFIESNRLDSFAVTTLFSLINGDPGNAQNIYYETQASTAEQLNFYEMAKLIKLVGMTHYYFAERFAYRDNNEKLKLLEEKKEEIMKMLDELSLNPNALLDEMPEHIKKHYR